MTLSPNRADWVAYTAIGLVVVAGLALWPRLPTEMAIHFGTGGAPDDFVGRPVGVLLTPTIGVAVVLLIRRGRGLSGPAPSPALEDASVVVAGVVVAYVQGLILAWNVGVEFDVTVAVLPVLALAGVLTLYALWREGRLPIRG